MKFICISGSSGVGKSTFSRLLMNMLSPQNVTILCGDDTHLWERTNENWKYFTHFNPAANNLEKNYEDIVSLLQNKSIERSRYNHDTGKFDSPVSVIMNDVLIYEGLHALYHKPTYDMAQLKIYVDTDENLKNEWKLKRDIKKRGYKKSQVDDMIARRKSDEILYIQPQKLNANVLVKFSKVNDKIEMNYVCLDSYGEDFLKKIKQFYDKISTFVEICKKISFDKSLYQSSGGNVSIKDGTDIIITQSGKKFTNINFFNGYCLFSIPDITNCKNEIHYFDILKNASVSGIPSMESGMHFLFSQNTVIHSHATYVNTILCSKESLNIIKNLFSEYKYTYIPYTTPGYDLYLEMKRNKLAPIVFLENHGIVVADDNPKIAFSILENINSICKNWLFHHSDLFIDVTKKIDNVVLFPDAALFPEKTQEETKLLLEFMNQADLTPNLLDNEQIEKIKISKFEIYRKSLEK